MINVRCSVKKVLYLDLGIIRVLLVPYGSDSSKL